MLKKIEGGNNRGGKEIEGGKQKSETIGKKTRREWDECQCEEGNVNYGIDGKQS